MKTRILTPLVAVMLAATLGADAAWKWAGSFGDKAVEMLIIGDIQVHTRRADPLTEEGGSGLRQSRRPAGHVGRHED